MKYEYKPRGVCSSNFIIEVEDDIIKNVEIVGGCPGNTEAVCRLCRNRNINEVIEILKGIDCRGRGTSCPNELSKALESIMIKN